MLTPQDIQNKEFTKAVFGGYDMTGVDEFLESVTEDYGALYKENAILKSKIKVLVEKVEEYRSTEDAMRMALLTAQKMGDDMVKEAEQKKTALLEDAETAANRRMEELRVEIEAEEFRLAAAKERTRSFVEATRRLITEQEDFIARLGELLPPVPQEPEKAPEQIAAEKEEEILDTASQIDAAVSKIVSQEEEPKKFDDEGEPTRLFKIADHDDDEEDVTPRPRFDFKDLQFGKNYSADDND